jgi:APA family basic amino acid/polyamine antiporter
MAAFFSLTGETFISLALFSLRRREPDLPRPYTTKGYPFLPAIMVLGAITFLTGYIISNTMNSLYCIGILILIYPAFLISRRSLRN